MKQLKLALLDMNRGVPNLGMQGLRNILQEFGVAVTKGILGSEMVPEVSVDEFEVRKEYQVPGMDYDIYLSSGGPGDPKRNKGSWETQWYQLIDQIWHHNKTEQRKKYVFFVCHSFQMACRHFGLCDITRRKSTSFGIYPIHKTAWGKKDPLLEDLDDPFLAVDSRDWQLVQPKPHIFKKLGAKILSLEKIRTHVEYERALMAIRFSPEMTGTQFHPEADPSDMEKHFKKKANRDKVIRNFSEEKYQEMMGYLEDPDTITHTYKSVIPGFLRRAAQSLITVPYNEHAA